MINKNQFPLILLKNVDELLRKVNAITDENRETVSLSINSELGIEIKHIAMNSNFNFFIAEPAYENSRFTMALKYKPENNYSLKDVTIRLDAEGAIQRLNTWLDVVRQYDAINLTEEETILNEYEREFFNDIEIIDEDANTNPFDLNQQAALHRFLSKAIGILEAQKDDNKELLEQAAELREDLPRLTKKSTIRKLSQFLARVRKKSLPLLKEILEAAKKELIKSVITGGFKLIGQFIDAIT